MKAYDVLEKLKSWPHRRKDLSESIHYGRRIEGNDLKGISWRVANPLMLDRLCLAAIFGYIPKGK